MPGPGMPALDSPRCRMEAAFRPARRSRSGDRRHRLRLDEINGTIPTDQADALLADLDAVQQACRRRRLRSGAAGRATGSWPPSTASRELEGRAQDGAQGRGHQSEDVGRCEPSGATGPDGAQRDLDDDRHDDDFDYDPDHHSGAGDAGDLTIREQRRRRR